MSIPRRHHFIPAFYLEQWTGAEGKLIEYSRKRDKLISKPIGPRGTGYEFDLYAFNDLPPELAQHIEQRFFNYVDDVAFKALSLHLSTHGTVEWQPEIRSAWSRFVMALHTRHPDAMPELREGARLLWEMSGRQLQQDYEAIKTADDPPTYDAYLDTLDPHTPSKAQLNLLIAVFDNEHLGQRVNNMIWSVVDLSNAQLPLLLSDRPLTFFNLNKPDGVLFLPISPTRMFVAANEKNSIENLRRRKAKDLVKVLNRNTVGRARKYVWAKDRSQEGFIGKHMSTGMEPLPFFPSLTKFQNADVVQSTSGAAV